MLIAYSKGQKFREGFYQIMTAFSLPWYAAIGVAAGLSAGLPWIACLLIGIIGPTTGRFLIDITAGKAAKQFVRGEWFVGTAILTSVVYFLCVTVLGLTQWPATLISFVFGFTFRLTALYFLWEEPMPRIPPHYMGELSKRIGLKQRFSKDWDPLDDF